MVSTHLENISRLGTFPHIGVKKKSMSNHHLAIYKMLGFHLDDEPNLVGNNQRSIKHWCALEFQVRVLLITKKTDAHHGWQWKITNLDRRYISKCLVFYCHVIRVLQGVCQTENIILKVPLLHKVILYVKPPQEKRGHEPCKHSMLNGGMSPSNLTTVGRSSMELPQVEHTWHINRNIYFFMSGNTSC